MENKITNTIDLYDSNLNRLMDISKFIDEENEYSVEIQNDSIFIKLLFKDIKKCAKWYNQKEYKPIKAAIHNCYKLIQKGYVPENQNELDSNITILEKLIKDPNSKKGQLEKISEEVVQNIFVKTINTLNEKESNNINNNIENIKYNQLFNNSDYVTKNYMEKRLEDQKNYYEKKMEYMQDKINKLDSKVNNLLNLMENINKSFFIYNKEIMNDKKNKYK